MSRGRFVHDPDCATLNPQFRARGMPPCDCRDRQKRNSRTAEGGGRNYSGLLDGCESLGRGDGNYIKRMRRSPGD